MVLILEYRTALLVHELGLFRVLAIDSFLALGFLLFILVYANAQILVLVGEY